MAEPPVDLATPYLVVDLAVLERNVSTMAETVPGAESLCARMSHKCLEIAFAFSSLLELSVSRSRPSPRRRCSSMADARTFSSPIRSGLILRGSPAALA